MKNLKVLLETVTFERQCQYSLLVGRLEHKVCELQRSSTTPPPRPPQLSTLCLSDITYVTKSPRPSPPFLYTASDQNWSQEWPWNVATL